MRARYEAAVVRVYIMTVVPIISLAPRAQCGGSASACACRTELRRNAFVRNSPRNPPRQTHTKTDGCAEYWVCI